MSDAENGAGRREVAYRLFAAEYDGADLSYSAGEEERAPNYVVTPTGAHVNRAFVVGVLTEVTAVSDDVLRARVVDPTGAFVLYAGQYQPDEQAFLDRADTPAFVAVTGKARTFQPDDADQVYTSLRPESVTEVDADTRDRWTVATAERTLGRVGWAASALARDERGEELKAALAEDGADEGLSAGVALALDHYDTSPAYLADVRGMALDAARVVAGETDEVDTVPGTPDTPGEADLAVLAGLAGGRASTEASDEPQADQTAPEATGEGSAAGGPASAPVETGAEGTEAVEAEPAADAGGGSADVGDFEPAEFELDEEEREEIEEEFGTEFRSGAEVDEPGEADIETPDPDSQEAAVEETTAAEAAESGDATPAGGAEQAAEAETEEAADEDVDLEDATVELMRELDEGAGADREELVAAVADRHSTEPGEVEEAIQDALMDGRCYEPDDATLKPI